MTKGFVYFIGAPTADTIKIGFSTKPASRIRQIQSGNAERLEVLHIFPARKALESHLHELFKPYRLTGEWFSSAETIRNFARHVEFCHTARVLKLMNLPDWPADESEQVRVLDRFEAVAVTMDELMRAAADVFPHESTLAGMRRRKPPEIASWPAARAVLPA